MQHKQADLSILHEKEINKSLSFTPALCFPAGASYLKNYVSRDGNNFPKGAQVLFLSSPANTVWTVSHIPYITGH